MSARAIVTSMFCSAVAFGCGTEPELYGDSHTQEITHNLLQAGFPADDIMVVDDAVYVGRDVHVTLEASRELLETGDGSAEQYRTTNLVSSSKSKICVNPSSAFTGSFSTALDRALANYTVLPLSFDMVRGPTTGCSANISAVIQPGLVGGSAGFPSGGNPYSQIIIGGGLSTYGVDVIEHVITHELGHTIGLRHSDYYNRSISCGSGGNEGDATVGAIHIPGTPSTATVGSSIMNSCFRSVETGELTSTDETALSYLYGASDSDLIVRDGAGALQLYPFRNDTFYGNGGGVVVGNGFNFANYFVGTWTGDGSSDLIVRDGAGTLYLYPFRNDTFYGNGGGVVVGHGFNFPNYFIGDWIDDGTSDLIARDNAGTLYLYPFRNDTFHGNGGGVVVGNGFNFANYFVGNWTGDGSSDLIVRDSAGTLYLYPFRNDTFYGNGGGVVVGHNFNFADYFIGDWTGDGTSDLLVRDSAGTLYLYPFRNGTFYGNGGGVVVGNGFNFTNYFVGDWTADGTSDLLVRDSAGTLYLYPFRNGTFYGNGGGIVVGNGFNFTNYFVGSWTNP